MATIRTNFEKEIRGKLSQKSSRSQTEETILLKNFKFFDLNENGTVEFDEFVKAIEKIGVQTFNKGQLQELFEYYDSDESGALDYKEFSSIVLGGGATSKSEKRSGFSAEDIDNLIEKVKGILTKRGPGGILGLGKQFLIADKNKNRELEQDEFTYALRDFGCGLSDKETEALFNYFDKDRSGSVNFDEFIYSIRGKMNDFRKKLANQAFDIIDEDKSGELTIDDLRGRYNCKNHPDVKQGKKTEDQVLTEFLKTFENMYDYHRIDDDKVTRDEFLEYYAFISASIDNDQYFELMMNNSWRMNEGKNKNWDTKGWGSDQTSSPKKSAPAFKSAQKKEEDKPTTARGKRDEPQSRDERPQTRGGKNESKTEDKSSSKTDDAVNRVRAKLNARGAKGWIGLQRQFKIMDDDNDKEISLPEFTKAMKDFGCGLNDEETKAVFKYYDVDGSGALSIDEFVRGVRGEMNNFRKGLAKVAFKILDKNGDGTLQVNDIKGVYNAKNHPDVKAGKKTEDEILGEFLETFEAHHNLRAQSKRDQTVTLEEFIEYYNNVSSNIDNDKYFEVMMINSYKLWQYDAKYKEYGPTNTGKGWSNTQKSSGGAPFGTSEGTNDWSTSNRPSTARATKEEAKTVIKQGGSYTDENLIDLFRNKILSRGARGIIGLARLFKIIDDDNSKSLDLSEFSKACNDFRLDYSKDEIKRLFNVFDTNKNGDIDYDEFLRTVRGPMAQFRVKLVKQAFGKLDTDNSGTITLDEVRAKYNAKQHPDVKTGKKTEDDILMEFLDTFEIHHSIHTGDASSRDGTVTIAEFIEYYNNISSSIDDDKYFELMITNAWNLNNVSYQKGWKGEI